VNIAFNPSNWMHDAGIPSCGARACKSAGGTIKLQRAKTATMRLAAMLGESMAFLDTNKESAECIWNRKALS